MIYMSALLESGKRWIDELTHDLAYAIRLFRKSPGFTLAAALTLALGMGANTAVFSVLNAVLLRPLPYREPQKLVVIWDKIMRGSEPAPVFDSFADFVQIQRYAHSFSKVSAATWAAPARVWTDGGLPRTLLAIPATASFFDTLGVGAALGRTFTKHDEQRGCTVVLSHAFWQEKLASKRDVVGTDLKLDDIACTVVGVMPASFSFYPKQAQMWILAGPNLRPKREDLIVGIFARLKPGVSIAQAQSEVTALHDALHRADGHERDTKPFVFNLQDQFTFLAGRTLRATMWLTAGAVLFVLLIACLNVANLLLGRSFNRQRELAVRAALGSGQARLVRQLLTESLLLACAGALLGLGFALGAVHYLQQTNPIELPVGARLTMDFPVFVFSGLLTLGTAFAFGLLPAYRASRIDLNRALKTAGRSSAQQSSPRVFAKAMVTVEMTLSVVLLTAATVLMMSLSRMSSEPLGFDPHHLIYTGTAPRGSRYATDENKIRFYGQLWRKLQDSMPAAQFALGSTLPVYGGGFDALDIAGQTPKAANALGDIGQQRVSPGFFSVLKTPLLSGRDFDERDRSGAARVAIVNQTLAREYFPHGNALGSRIRIPGENHGDQWMTIVGVVGDARHSELMKEMSWVTTPVVYEPFLQTPPPSIFVFIRTNNAALGRTAQRVIAAVDAKAPVDEVTAMDSNLSILLSFARFRAILIGAFAATAILLAAIGLHGVLSQLVSQRIPEFGIRMALGAKGRDLIVLVASQGGIPVLAGLVLGGLGTLAFKRFFASLVTEVPGYDRLALLAVAGVLVIVAGAAIVMPAKRAAGVDPAAALRSE